MKYDVIAIGMGPSSVFLAYELIQKKKAKNVLKFVVEEPSLNEIFVEKVGEEYDK